MLSCQNLDAQTHSGVVCVCVLLKEVLLFVTSSCSTVKCPAGRPVTKSTSCFCSRKSCWRVLEQDSDPSTHHLHTAHSLTIERHKPEIKIQIKCALKLRSSSVFSLHVLLSSTLTLTDLFQIFQLFYLLNYKVQLSVWLSWWKFLQPLCGINVIVPGVESIR